MNSYNQLEICGHPFLFEIPLFRDFNSNYLGHCLQQAFLRNKFRANPMSVTEVIICKIYYPHCCEEMLSSELFWNFFLEEF